MNNRLLRPTSGFNPRSIAGLSVWLDALDPGTYTESSGQVSEWRSKVGSIIFTQSTANDRPTLFESASDTQNATKAVVNNRQAFYFDGTNDQLLGSVAIEASQWTAFAVIRPDDITAVRGVFTRDPASGGVSQRGPQLLRHNDAGIVQSIGFSTSGNYTAESAAAMSNGTAFVMHAVQTSATLQCFLNNAPGTGTAGTQNSSSTTPVVGASTTAGASQFFRGTCGEILLYSSALPILQQTVVYEYLRKKWGIA
jgi:hypothetical protein